MREKVLNDLSVAAEEHDKDKIAVATLLLDELPKIPFH